MGSIRQQLSCEAKVSLSSLAVSGNGIAACVTAAKLTEQHLHLMLQVCHAGRIPVADYRLAARANEVGPLSCLQ